VISPAQDHFDPFVMAAVSPGSRAANGFRELLQEPVLAARHGARLGIHERIAREEKESSAPNAESTSRRNKETL